MRQPSERSVAGGQQILGVGGRGQRHAASADAVESRPVGVSTPPRLSERQASLDHERMLARCRSSGEAGGRHELLKTIGRVLLRVANLECPLPPPSPEAEAVRAY